MLQILIVVITLVCYCTGPISAASLGHLSKPEAKAKPVKKLRRKKVKKKAKPKPAIEAAILIELPSHKSLIAKRSASETQMIDQKAIDLLFSSSLKQNSELARAQKIASKNFLSRGKEQAIDLIQNSKLKLQEQYQSWRAYYQPRYQRDQNLAQTSANAAQKLISMTNQTTLLELEKLTKGNR
ncbi:MAG: hypothetical protein OXU45_04530 [Candidatus Melainabacteria bacterium]|nr:hypothetical protein [Candidatus Melainabacteria bacterium]